MNNTLVSPVFSQTKNLFPLPQKPNNLDADNQLLNDILELKLIKNQKKEIEAQEKLLEETIKQKLGEKELITFKNVVIASYKYFERNSFQTKIFQKELPKLYNKFSTTSTYRKFQIH